MGRDSRLRVHSTEGRCVSRSLRMGEEATGAVRSFRAHAKCEWKRAPRAGPQRATSSLQLRLEEDETWKGVQKKNKKRNKRKMSGCVSHENQEQQELVNSGKFHWWVKWEEDWKIFIWSVTWRSLITFVRTVRVNGQSPNGSQKRSEGEMRI